MNVKTKPSSKKSLRDHINEKLCPLLLGAVVFYAIASVLYRPGAYLYTGLFLAEEVLCFFLFDFLQARRFLGGVLYTLLLVAVFALAAQLLAAGAAQTDPMAAYYWFYGRGSYDENQPMFLLTFTLGGGFFLTSILYYFTQVRYRTLGVMLSILFPFFLYAKRSETMKELLITLIITLFLAVVVHNRRLNPVVEPKKRGSLKVDRAYLLSFAVFISVTGAVTMMIDKPTYEAELEKNEDFFDFSQDNSPDPGNYEMLYDLSSAMDGGFDFQGNPLFYFRTGGSQSVYYLRGQAFDRFDGGSWKQESVGEREFSAYSAENPEYGTDDILSDMRALAEAGAVEPFDTDSLYTLRTARAYDEDFRPAYLPAPYGTVTDSASLNRLSIVKDSRTTTIYRASAWRDNEIAVLNDTFTYPELSREIYTYADALNLTGEGYRALLSAQAGDGAAGRLLSDYERALEQYTDQTGISDRLRALSLEITEAYGNDIEKAAALEIWFEENGFLYSLESIPENKDIDYFVFESKRGYCAGYATAMTLMARAAGLPARYVEGFAAFEPAEDGAFVVREGHAHAFVEVYLPGAGWITFDPTVSDYRDYEEETDGISFGMLILRIINRFIVVLIVAGVLLFLLLRDAVTERLFRLRLRFAPIRRRTLLLYGHARQRAGRSTKRDFSAYTTEQLAAYLSESRGVSLPKLFSLFERTAFGGYEPSGEEYREAYREYKRSYRWLKRRRKQMGEETGDGE